MFLKNALFALRALLLASLLASPALAGPVVNSGHIESELVAQEAGIAPGGTVYVALRQKIIPGWHTYWRNPGDAGEATKITWTLPAGWSAGDMVWPTPKKAKLGPLLDYAYEGEVLIPVPISAPANAQVGATISLTADVFYLVCEQVCVPEEAKLTMLLQVVAGVPSADPKWGAIVGEVLAKAPKPAGLKAVFKLDGQTLKLAVVGGPLKGADMAGAYFYPYSPKVIEHAAEQTIERGPEGLTLTLKPGYDFVGGGTAPEELQGVLATKAGAWEVTAVAGDPPATLGRMLAGATLAFADDRDFALVLKTTFDSVDPAERRRQAAKAAFKAFPRLERIACTLRVQDSVVDQALSAVMLTREGDEVIETRAEAIHLTGVIDRVGGGDAFASGVLFGLFSGWADQESLDFGLAAAGLKHSVPGDFNLFTAGEVRAAMANGGFDIRR